MTIESCRAVVTFILITLLRLIFTSGPLCWLHKPPLRISHIHCIDVDDINRLLRKQNVSK